MQASANQGNTQQITYQTPTPQRKSTLQVWRDPPPHKSEILVASRSKQMHACTTHNKLHTKHQHLVATDKPDVYIASRSKQVQGSITHNSFRLLKHNTQQITYQTSNMVLSMLKPQWIYKVWLTISDSPVKTHEKLTVKTHKNSSINGFSWSSDDGNYTRFYLWLTKTKEQTELRLLRDLSGASIDRVLKLF